MVYILQAEEQQGLRQELEPSNTDQMLWSPSDFIQHSYKASWFVKMGLRINRRRKKRQYFQVCREADENTLEKIRLQKPKIEQQAGGSLNAHVLMACRSKSAANPALNAREGQETSRGVFPCCESGQ